MHIATSRAARNVRFVRCRLGAVGVVAIVLASTTVRAQDASCNGNGLAENGGFICGANGAGGAVEWRDQGAAFSCDDAAGALLGADGDRVRQVVDGLLPEVSYTFRYRGLRAIAGVNAIVAVRVFAAGATEAFAGQDDSLPPSGELDTGLREFSFTASTTQIVVEISRPAVEGDNGGSLIDDVVITPAEIRRAGIDNVIADADSDTLSDREELCLTLTNPRNADSDGDGLADNVELGGTYGLELRPDPNNPDSDGDGLCDGNNDVVPVCVFGEDINNNGTIFSAGDGAIVVVDGVQQR